MVWSLLPNALRPFKIYCAPPNLGITRTWIWRFNFVAWGSLTSLKSQIRDPQLKDPPGGGLVLRIFTSWKNPSTSAGFEPADHGFRGEHVTPRPPRLGSGKGRVRDYCRTLVKEKLGFSEGMQLVIIELRNRREYALLHWQECIANCLHKIIRRSCFLNHIWGLLEKHPTFFSQKPGECQWSMLPWGDLEPWYACVNFFLPVYSVSWWKAPFEWDAV